MKSALGVVLVLVSLLVACGNDDDEPTAASPSTEQQQDHNEADVQFAQAMIPHHEQAVEMAQLADARASDPQVKELATQIEAAQEPEIETMTGWLEDWGESTDEMSGMSDDEMSGMGEDQMASLEEATGAEFDRLFLEQMIEHHRSAIEMAESQLEDGQFEEAIALARTIRDTQRQEVETMQELLASVG